MKIRIITQETGFELIRDDQVFRTAMDRLAPPAW